MARNEVRIIGGKWRGRKLGFPAQQQLRPSLGRVRETLFNWLRERVIDSRCLDLYAGSGALGFEALSRGAATATLVEQDRRTADSLRQNAARLGAAAECRVICMAAERFLTLPDEPWDVILLDPPFVATLTSSAAAISPAAISRPAGRGAVTRSARTPDEAAIRRYHATVTKILAQIRRSGALADDGVVYLESPRAAEYRWEHWQTLKHASAGATQSGLLVPACLATI